MATTVQSRPVTSTDSRAAAPEVVVRVVGEADGGSGGGGTRRPPRRIGSGGLRTVGVLGALGAIAVAIVLLANAIGGFDLTLFGTTRVDRSAPVVLRELRDVSEFKAATGEFQATIDIEDDVDLLPSFIMGERTIFVGVGTVDATVDFSGLGPDAVVVGSDGAVTVTLPRPRLGTPAIDPARSNVANRDRGLVNRITGAFRDSPTSERELYLLAQERLAKAARGSALQERAEENTVEMLRSLLGAVGFDRVDVVFSGDAGRAAPAPEA